MRAIAMATALALLPVPALPHDLWSNGQPIPDWISPPAAERLTLIT